VPVPAPTVPGGKAATGQTGAQLIWPAPPLSPADAGRGRPWPDLPLTALLRLRGGAVGELAVAGDTASDIDSGRRAGAAIVAGVLTGASTRAELEQAGAPLILDTIAGILPCITG
jgi:phosphoglycolate phosphatase